MPNPYFQFKQFEIRQEFAAMKVSTDSCLFGAWVAAEAARQYSGNNRMLDVGTGTGLLLLMLAQKCEAAIDAVEIDATAAAEAAGNCSRSAWSNRLQVFQADVRQFNGAEKYDLVVSNPPFYEGSLLSDRPLHNIAHHDAGLTLQQLANFVNDALKEGGSFAVLLPFFREEEMIRLCAAYNLLLQKKVRVRHAPAKPILRSMLWFQKTDTGASAEEEICIYSAAGVYSEAFTAFLQPYYLFL